MHIFRKILRAIHDWRVRRINTKSHYKYKNLNGND